MIIDNNLELDNPTIELQWSFVNPKIIVSAVYNKKHSRFIGTFNYSNGWVFTLNQDNTKDVNNYFKDLSIDKLNIDNLEYYEPPKLTGYGVVIPSEFLWVFPQEKFVLNGFEIPLVSVAQGKAVDVAYFLWVAFRNELDSGRHDYLKRALMPLWDYVELQVIQQNLIAL